MKVLKIKKSWSYKKINNIINKYNLSDKVIFTALDRIKKIDVIIL